LLGGGRYALSDLQNQSRGVKDDEESKKNGEDHTKAKTQSQQIHDQYVTIEKHGTTVYIYLRLPVYDLEGIKRGLRQQLVLSLHQEEVTHI
jgi:hypothetical protein